MKLYFLRHGIAEERSKNKSDDERQLTPEGRLKTRKVAQGLEHMGVEPKLILSSPLPRAVQTAEIAGEVLRKKRDVVICEHLKPGGHIKEVMAKIKEQGAPEEVMLVGHEPDMTEMMAELLAGETQVKIKLKKAGCACLEVDKIPPMHRATLLWLMTSKQMRKLK